MKKKLDSRLPKLLADAAKTDTRSLLVIVGDRGNSSLRNHVRRDGRGCEGSEHYEGSGSNPNPYP